MVDKFNFLYFFDERTEQYNQKESFITLKYRKENSKNNPKYRLINPANSEIKTPNFIWGKKKNKIKDKAKPYSLASRKCMLCLTEKYHIIFSKKNLLNKRNEMVTKCRQENKFYLANYNDIPP